MTKLKPIKPKPPIYRPFSLRWSKRPYSVNYLQGFWLRFLKECYYKFVRFNWHAIVRTRLPFGSLLRYKPSWRDVAIAFLLGALLFSRATGRTLPEPINLPKVPKAVVRLADTKLQPVELLQPETPPQPVYVAPTNTAPSGCGDNMYANFIYMHESGCRTNAINPIGACGIGQALPCSKMGCSLSDYACQNAWFTNYANAVYGGWLGAYNHWLAFSWW